MTLDDFKPLVCIDGFCPNPEGRLTGNFVHARELTAALDRSRLVDLVVLVDRYTQPVFEQLRLRARLFFCESPTKGKISDQFAVSRALDYVMPTLFHKPTGQLPLTGLSCPAVMSIADLNFKHLPVGGVKRLYKELTYRRAIERAEAVICVSEFTRGEVEAHYPQARRKTTVIHHGANRLPAPDRTLAQTIEAPWFLAFGQHRHKNVEVCLEAIARLAKGDGPASAARLVVVGSGRNIDDGLRRQAERLGVADRVVFAGRVSDAVLHGLYQEATGLLFMSHYEGFGLPILEAMAAGCPVVASDVCSHSEVAGAAAVLLAPDDADGLAAMMERLTPNTAWRRGLRERGRARAACFSWDAAAIATVGVYRSVLTALSCP